MPRFYDYGPGDECTWGPCVGHRLDPRTDDNEEDYMTQYEAEEAAGDEFLSTPELVADWLAKETTGQREAITVDLEAPARELSIGALLVLVLTGAQADATRARYELRDRFLAAHRQDLQEFARDLMAAHNGTQQ